MTLGLLEVLPQPVVDFMTYIMEWMVETAADAETWQQVLVMMAGGAIPFVESYVASLIGVLVGIPAPLAVAAAVAGNVICMLILTVGAGGARGLFTRSRGVDQEQTPSKRRQRMARIMSRFGVPGVCLLTPLVLPTMITAPILVGMGAKKGNVIGWMTLSIIGWGVLFGFFGDWVSAWFM